MGTIIRLDRRSGLSIEEVREKLGLGVHELAGVLWKRAALSDGAGSRGGGHVGPTSTQVDAREVPRHGARQERS